MTARPGRQCRWRAWSCSGPSSRSRYRWRWRWRSWSGSRGGRCPGERVRPGDRGGRRARGGAGDRGLDVRDHGGVAVCWKSGIGRLQGAECWSDEAFFHCSSRSPLLGGGGVAGGGGGGRAVTTVARSVRIAKLLYDVRLLAELLEVDALTEQDALVEQALRRGPESARPTGAAASVVSARAGAGVGVVKNVWIWVELNFSRSGIGLPIEFVAVFPSRGKSVEFRSNSGILAPSCTWGPISPSAPATSKARSTD